MKCKQVYSQAPTSRNVSEEVTSYFVLDLGSRKPARFPDLGRVFCENFNFLHFHVTKGRGMRVKFHRGAGAQRG